MSALFVALLLGTGCRGMHEGSIRQRLPAQRFFSRDVQVPLHVIDKTLMAVRYDPRRPWCELCTVRFVVTSPVDREYCLSSREEISCFHAKATSQRAVHFESLDGSPRSQVVRALWLALEPDVARPALELSDDEVEVLAEHEEENFPPKWTMTAGARVGSVISFDPPAFTFGGSIGFRRWAGPFLIAGATLDAENAVQATRNYGVIAVNGRVELSLWEEDNERWWNLPRVSFFVGAGPLVGIGRSAALGGRAVAGVQLTRLGSFPTPFFFEFGYQVLDLDKQTSSGLRVALGLGF
ncbi:MAG: hypothetical protein ACO1OB_11110 [Archangium sp.]